MAGYKNILDVTNLFAGEVIDALQDRLKKINYQWISKVIDLQSAQKIHAKKDGDKNVIVQIEKEINALVIQRKETEAAINSIKADYPEKKE